MPTEHPVPDHDRPAPTPFEQLERYIDQTVESLDGPVGKHRTYLREKLARIMRERNERAEEIRTPEVREAADIANRLFGCRTFINYCVDGRVVPALMFGIVAGIRGGRLESPAGDSPDFVRSRDARDEFALVIRPGSPFEELLRVAMEKNPERLVQVLDSHCGCAAKEGECGRLAKETDDKGLRRDVLRKRGMARAMESWARTWTERNGNGRNGRRVIAIQTSFDPHHGDLYMGLETDEALQRSEGTDFTPEILDALAAEGKIIATGRLAREPRFATTFETLYSGFDPKPDWGKAYAQTAIQFWKAMDEMAAERDSLLSEVCRRLIARTGPYPDLRDEHELRHRSLLVLANAFNAYCNNRDGRYEFHEHEEPFVEVSEKRYGPYAQNNGFGVAIHHPKRPEHTAFSASIVRKNRLAGRTRSAVYDSPQEFAEAPVPVIVKEVVRRDLSEEEWTRLRRIDWSFLREADWSAMDTGAFKSLLLRHGVNVDLDVFDALDKLRQAMADLYSPEEDTGPELLNGSLFAMPVLANGQRGMELVIPFHLRGY